MCLISLQSHFHVRLRITLFEQLLIEMTFWYFTAISIYLPLSSQEFLLIPVFRLQRELMFAQKEPRTFLLFLQLVQAKAFL